MVIAERLIAPTGLKFARINEPERIPIRSEMITCLVRSARVIATRGGTIVNHPYSTSHNLTFDRVALLAKKAVIRDVGTSNPHPKYAQLERELLEEINKLGIGPQGFGGRTTALAVNIEFAPCHIASLPVACNLNCHAGPHDFVVI
jgi:hypothetical protein